MEKRHASGYDEATKSCLHLAWRLESFENTCSSSIDLSRALYAKFLNAAKNLETLRISRKDFEVSFTTATINYPFKLKKFQVSECTGTSLEVLRKFLQTQPRLQELDLYDINFEGPPANCIAKMSTQAVDLTETPYDFKIEKSLEAIMPNLPELEALKIRKMSQEMMEFVSVKNPKLKRLSLSNLCPITPKFPKLESLELTEDFTDGIGSKVHDLPSFLKSNPSVDHIIIDLRRFSSHEVTLKEVFDDSNVTKLSIRGDLDQFKDTLAVIRAHSKRPKSIELIIDSTQFERASSTQSEYSKKCSQIISKLRGRSF